MQKITVSDHFCVLSDKETVSLHKQGFLYVCEFEPATGTETS